MLRKQTLIDLNRRRKTGTPLPDSVSMVEKEKNEDDPEEEKKSGNGEVTPLPDSLAVKASPGIKNW